VIAATDLPLVARDAFLLFAFVRLLKIVLWD
jgi:hypothetical protein